MNDSPQQVQEEPQAQLDSGGHNCIDGSDNSVSCPVISGIPEMPLASDVEETRDLCTHSGIQPTSMATPTPMLTPSTPEKYLLRDR